MRITKVYTRSGDSGETGLVGGERVVKEHPRVEAYGTVDELSSQLGAARAELARCEQLAGTDAGHLLDRQLEYLQHQLFNLGGCLATPPEQRAANQPSIDQQVVSYLESLIDRYNDELPALKEFVLPGGSPLASTVHVARCVARRAERRLLTLHRREPCTEAELAFLNRLSDLLFVLARWTNQASGVAEFTWRHDVTPPDVSS